MYITGSQDTKDVKVVRALWGSYLIDIPSPQYDEVVYVWGKENKAKLDELGYTTVKMTNNLHEWGYEMDSYQYIHKIFAIQKALETFDKILFLDWDVKLIKDLDDEFFNGLPTNSFQAPLYSVSKNQIQNIPYLDDTWIGFEKRLTPNFTWEYGDLYAKVNACCIYTDIKDFGNQLLKISKENRLGSYIEEFAIFKLANKKLNYYVLFHCPTYILIPGQESINSYVSSSIQINPYFSY